MSFGIPPKSMGLILNTLRQYPEIEKAGIFGSRAQGNYKNGSDIDLVIYGPKVTSRVTTEISVMLNEDLPLPYYFDVLCYDSLQDEPIKEHIDQVARTIYSAS